MIHGSEEDSLTSTFNEQKVSNAQTCRLSVFTDFNISTLIINGNIQYLWFYTGNLINVSIRESLM